MVTLARRILQHGSYVFRFQIRVIVQQLFARGACSQKIEDILHPDAQATNAWAPSANLGVDRDSVQFAQLGHAMFV